MRRRKFLYLLGASALAVGFALRKNSFKETWLPLSHHHIPASVKTIRSHLSPEDFKVLVESSPQEIDDDLIEIEGYVLFEKDWDAPWRQDFSK